MTVYTAANMGAWRKKAKENALFVVLQSIQDVSRIAQNPKAKGGRMPVDIGTLRNTYSAGLNGTTSLKGPDSYIAALAGMDLGDSFIGGWTTDYAMRMEKGFVGQDALGRNFNQTGNFFMASALAQWQEVNDLNAAKVASQ